MSDPRLQSAQILLAVRIYKSPEAPFGVLGGLDLGAVYVSRETTDLALQIHGTRAAAQPEAVPPVVNPPADQEWATPAMVAEAGLNRPFDQLTPAQQANLTRATEAAQRSLTAWVGDPWGVA